MAIASPPPTSLAETGWSPRAAAVVAGLGLLALAVVAVLADQFLTAAARGDLGPLRVATVLFLGVACLDLLVAVSLHAFLAPVHRGLSMFAATLRVTYTAVLLAAIGQLAVAVAGSEGDVFATSAVEAFRAIWTMGLAIFGAHLLMVGVLAWRARFMPNWLGVLLLVAGLGYVIDGFGPLAVAGYDLHLTLYTFVGEVALLGWLLIRARRLPSRSAQAPLITREVR